MSSNLADDLHAKLARSIADNERVSLSVEEASFLFDLVRNKDPRLAAAEKVVEAYRAYRIAEEVGFPGDHIFYAAVDALDAYDIAVGNEAVYVAADKYREERGI